MPRYIPSAEERFWARVNKTETCWLWTGSTNRYGYGQITVNSREDLAHRLSYKIHMGDIPNDLFVLHSCDVPACVNPAHLSLGTHAENMADKQKKGRQALGEKNGQSRFTEEDIRTIRRLYWLKGIGSPQLGFMYGADEKHMRDIVRGRRWPHVENFIPPEKASMRYPNGKPLRSKQPQVV